MKTYVQSQATLPFTVSGSAVTAGQAILIGASFGVVIADAAVGEVAVQQRVGAVQLPKATGQAWTVGAALYWDATNSVATTTASGNKVIGLAFEAAASGDATGMVMLTGQLAL